jgi:hypothetical protein
LRDDVSNVGRIVVLNISLPFSPVYRIFSFIFSFFFRKNQHPSIFFIFNIFSNFLVISIRPFCVRPCVLYVFLECQGYAFGLCVGSSPLILALCLAG